METSEKKKNNKDYWMVIYTVILLTVFPKIGNLIFPQYQGILFSGICGAIGGGIGAGIYTIIKNKGIVLKISILIILTAVLFSSLFLFVRLNSDQEIVKKSWKTHKIGKVSFQYPAEFTQLEIGPEVKNQNCEIKIFSDNNNERIAMYLIYDFIENPLTMEESLSGSVLNALENIGATENEWFDTNFSENTLSTKFKYKIEEKEYTGYGFIFNKDYHFESVYFIPYSKNYSNEYLNKIVENIIVD